jgi:hypothetical protein
MLFRTASVSLAHARERARTLAVRKNMKKSAIGVARSQRKSPLRVSRALPETHSIIVSM